MLLGGLHFAFGYDLPTPNSRFIIYSILGSVAQILASELLLRLFAYRNFFASTTYSKTESIQTAALGLVVLSDSITLGAIAGFILGIIGVLIISNNIAVFNIKQISRSIYSRPTLIGLSSGLLFALAAVSYRGASLSLDGDFIIKASFTLCSVLTLQTLLVGLFIFFFKPTALARKRNAYGAFCIIGFSGMSASLCWMSAMVLQNAAYVRALGQIELVFALLASILVFKEKICKSELIGFLFIVSGITALLFYK